MPAEAYFEEFLAVLPEHEAGLSLACDDHKSSYQSVRDYIAMMPGYYDEDSWVSPEERDKAISEDSLWTLQWYPHTPVGYNVLHASSLEAIIEKLEDD